MMGFAVVDLVVVFFAAVVFAIDFVDVADAVAVFLAVVPFVDVGVLAVDVTEVVFFGVAVAFAGVVFFVVFVDDVADVVVVVDVTVDEVMIGVGDIVTVDVGSGKMFDAADVVIVVARQTSSASLASLAHEAPFASEPKTTRSKIPPFGSRKLTSSPLLFNFAEGSVTTRKPDAVTGVPAAIVVIFPCPS
jgi:hypothetical protein